MRKDLDEFRKQKLVIGSIIAMPIVLGVVMPILLFVPIVSMGPVGNIWDVNGLAQVGTFQGEYLDPITNQTLLDTSISSQIIHDAFVKEVSANNCVFVSCVIHNSNLSNSTIHDSVCVDDTLDNVTLIHSEGNRLDGQNILTVDSNVTFARTKESEVQQVVPMMLNMVLMIFIIVPATLPTIIASYSIVGEKNNRSLEPLLATPITDGELLAGKIFSSFLPSMGSTFLAFTLGVVFLDILFIPHVGFPLLPSLSWLLSILLLAPTACIMSVLACVIISSKVSDVRAAQQVGGFVVMPVVGLMLAVISGAMLLSYMSIVVFAMVYLGIDVILFYFARAIFNRESILEKWS